MGSFNRYNCSMSEATLRPYVLGGKAIFTLYSSKTNLRHTFRIKRGKNETWYQIQRLFGEDNTRDYRVLGVFRIDESGMLCTKYNESNAAQLQIDYFLRVLYDRNRPLLWPSTMYCYPSKRCARCGRLLTTPESVMTGFGPKCKGRW